MKRKRPKTILDSIPKSAYKGRWGVGDVQARACTFDNKKAKRLEEAQRQDKKDW